MEAYVIVHRPHIKVGIRWRRRRRRRHTIISHSTILQYNHNIWYGSYAEKKYWTRKTMISTGLPYLQFSITVTCWGFSPARLTWPAYGGGRKRENSPAWKHRIIVASTCRRSVEFGRYVTQCWHVSPRRGETGRQKYFLPGRQKYLSALVSPLWAETSQLFTCTALFNAFNSRFGTIFTLYKLSVGNSMGIGCSQGLHHSPASKGIPIKPLSSCCWAIFSQLVWQCPHCVHYRSAADEDLWWYSE